MFNFKKEPKKSRKTEKAPKPKKQSKAAKSRETIEDLDNKLAAARQRSQDTHQDLLAALAEATLKTVSSSKGS